MQLPITYYKGYKAWITDEQNGKHPVEVGKNENTGLIQINVGNKLSGHVTVKYGGTAVQFVSELITLVTMIMAVVIYGVKRRKAGNTDH